MKRGFLVGIGIFALIVVSIFLLNNQDEAGAGNVPKPENSSSQLKEKYQSEFQQIDLAADKRVDSIIAQASDEFHHKQGQKDELKAKYAAMLDNDEEKTKQQFDSVYKRMEQEAVKQKLAMTFGKDFTETYHLKKAERFTKLNTKLDEFFNQF
ncbi:hypothetical protein [Bacillus salipaludis]|uniref:Uncharacterized protein n=1 Tax=Bacillus salipaludis TaxID=2547811 RepID=A0ABW8RDB7_9BACI